MALEKYTLTNIINHSAEKFTDRPALGDINGEKFTYGELRDKIKILSQLLKDKGIIYGDKVAIISENMANWGVAFFAITSIGAVAVPIMTEFHENEIKHILRHSGAKGIFVSQKLYGKVEEYKSDNLVTRILIDNFAEIPDGGPSSVIKNFINSGKSEFTKMREAALKFTGKIKEERAEEDLASIVYTSGTTGHSKGVMLTHKNIVSNVIDTMNFIKVDETDRLVSVLPLAHTYECTLGMTLMLYAGAFITYLDRPPTASVLIPAVQKIKPTIMCSVPLIFEKIYRAKILPEINKRKVTKLAYKFAPLRKQISKAAGGKLMKTFGGEIKLFALGGAAIAPDVERFMREAGFPYAVGYGLTETAPLSTGTDQFSTKYRSCGKALETVDVKIIDPDPKTGVGEIGIKGPNVMSGYYKDPEKTEEVFTKDGWFRSGDLGLIDKDGYVFIKGRSKNVIIGSNGKNIYPEEIESVINQCEFVLESLVLEKGEKLHARIHPDYEAIDREYNLEKMDEKGARQVISDVLKDCHKQVNDNVASFAKIASVTEQTEPFEKTPTQKIKRYLYV